MGSIVSPLGRVASAAVPRHRSDEISLSARWADHPQRRSAVRFEKLNLGSRLTRPAQVASGSAKVQYQDSCPNIVLCGPKVHPCGIGGDS
jgi:hypothetical protein